MSFEDLLEEAAEAVVADADLGSVSLLAKDLAEADAEVRRLEGELKEAKAGKEKIAKGLLPDAMISLNLSRLDLESGQSVQVKPFYSIAYTEKDNKDPAFEWLEENDFGYLIKCVITVELDKDMRKEAIEIIELLATAGYDSYMQRTIHYQTLLKWFKENNEAAIPDKLFNTFIGQEAKIK